MKRALDLFKSLDTEIVLTESKHNTGTSGDEIYESVYAYVCL